MPSISCFRAATRVALLSTTALVTLPSAAFAIDYVIDDPTTSTVILGQGTADTLLLTTDTDADPDTIGAITSVSPGVAVIDVADSITVDSGSAIVGIEVGIEIEGNGTDLTGGILNDGTIAAGAGSGSGVAIEVEEGADISGGISNTGLIVGEDTAIVLSGTFIPGVSTSEGTSGGYYSGGSISGGIVNSGGIIGEDFGGIIAYNGGTISGGIVNEEEAGILGEYVGIGVFAGGDIAGGIEIVQNTPTSQNTIAGIENRGFIEGGYVGIAVIGASPDLIMGEEGYTFNESHLDNPNRFGADISGGINNTGTIIGEYVAIGTAIHGDISGGIVNGEGGLIGLAVDDTGCTTEYYRSYIGIASLGSSDISGAIVNSGVIFGEMVSIGTAAGGDISGGIVNEAGGLIGLVVAGSGYYGDPIRSDIGIGTAYYGAISGGITNSGAIYGDEAAIGAASNSMIGGIVNNEGGTIGEAGETSDDTSENGITIVGGSVVSSTAAIPTLADITVASSPLAPLSSDVAVGITNSGVIIGNSAAIFVRGEGSDIAGALINTETGVIGRNSYGTVTAEMGIEVDQSGAISGGIINRGTIFGDTTGIQVASNASIGGISNSGNIGLSVVDGEDTLSSEYGIKVTDGSVISSMATGGGSGFDPEAIEGGIAILNSGTITGEDAAIYVGGVGSDISGTIVNEASGVIEGYVTGSNEDNYGIEVRSGGAITGGIDNSGVIFGEDAAISLSTSSVIRGIVNNAGGVIGEDSTYSYISDVGIYVGEDSIVSTTASPATTINVNSDVTSAALATGITNSGVIVGDDYGIEISSQGTVGATTGVGISNLASGAIFGDTAAIRIRGVLNGGLSNAGLIQGDDVAIEISGSDAEITGDIINWGGGIITGDTYGIAILDEASITTNIINHVSGSILATSDDDIGTAAIVIGEGSTLTGNIQNSGTIESTSSGAGIAIRSSSTLAGSLVNNSGTIEGEDYVGRIIGDDYGIRISSGAEITGGITNAGLISGQDSTGLLIENSTVGSITNSGTIRGEDNGIRLGEDAELTGDLENSGTVIATSGTGILIQESSTVANIDNSGLIMGEDGGNGLTIASGGSVTGGLTNSGTIVGTYDAVGLALYNGGSIVGNVTNTGYIGGENAGIYMATGGSMASLLNGADGEVVGEDYGIYLGEGGSFTNATNSINNAGLISASFGTGIYAETGASIGTITNSGTISGGDEDSQAIQFDNGVSTLILQTGSNLIGDIDGGAGGEDTLILEGYGTEDSTFTDFEALIVNADADGIWTLSDETTEIGGLVEVNSGTLLVTGDLIAESATVAEDGNLDVEGLLDLGSGTLIVDGIVDGSGIIAGTVIINGILSPGNSPGKLTFAGPITETTGSVYIVEHDANFPGLYQTDLTEVTVGSATIEPGVTVQLEVAPGTDGFADDILTAVGGVIGTYDELTIEEDNIVALIVYPDANTVAIVAGKTDAIVATTATVSDAGFVFMDNLQEGARRDGRIWATGYIYSAENEGLGQNGADFDQDAFGFNAGIDVISQPDLKVGVAVGYINGDIDIQSATSDAENDGIFGAAYLNYMSDDFYLDGTLMIGQQSVDITRKLTTGDAKGSSDATSYGANLEAGFVLAALGGRLSPFVKVGIHSASLDAYSESGADGAMTVGKVETQQMRLGAGLRYAVDLGSPDGIQVTPALKLGVTQQWQGGDSSVDIGFVGYTGSTTASLDFEDQTTIDLGISFDVKLSEAVTAFAGWDAALGDETTRNTGTIGLSINW